MGVGHSCSPVSKARAAQRSDAYSVSPPKPLHWIEGVPKPPLSTGVQAGGDEGWETGNHHSG